MFHVRSAKLLPAAAFAALAFCFAPLASAQWPEEISDPGTPPSEFPDHSGELNNFGSKFVLFFSPRADTAFVPRAQVNCDTCKFPVDAAVGHTFTLTGRILAAVKPDGAVDVDPATLGVYLMNIKITGVKAIVSTPVAANDGTSESFQTIQYEADLNGTAPFRAALSGTLVLDSQAGEPTPTEPPGLENGATIKVAATLGPPASEDPATEDLIVNVTFPAVPASSPRAMGQAVRANVVFQVFETKRLRLP